MIDKDTSKGELERIFYSYMERYFTSFDRHNNHPASFMGDPPPIDTKLHDIAMVAHNELVRRSNEEFAQKIKQAWRSSERSARLAIKLSKLSVGLTIAAVLLAVVTIWYNQADMHSDETWQKDQLELLQEIQLELRNNTQTVRDLRQVQQENDSLKTELLKAEMLIRAYEK